MDLDLKYKRNGKDDFQNRQIKQQSFQGSQAKYRNQQYDTYYQKTFQDEGQQFYSNSKSSNNQIQNNNNSQSQSYLQKQNQGGQRGLNQNKKEYNSLEYQFKNNKLNTGGHIGNQDFCYGNKRQDQTLYQSTYRTQDNRSKRDSNMQSRPVHKLQSEYGKLSWTNKDSDREDNQYQQLQPQNSFNPQALWIQQGSQVPVENSVTSKEGDQEQNKNQLHSDYYFYGKIENLNQTENKAYNKSALKSQPITYPKYNTNNKQQIYSKPIDDDSPPPGVHAASKTLVSAKSTKAVSGRGGCEEWESTEGYYQNNDQISPPGLFKLKSINEQQWENHKNIRNQNKYQTRNSCDFQNIKKQNQSKQTKHFQKYRQNNIQDNLQRIQQSQKHNIPQKENQQYCDEKQKSSQVTKQQIERDDLILPPGLEKAKSQAHELLSQASTKQQSKLCANQNQTDQKSSKEGSQNSFNSIKVTPQKVLGTPNNSNFNNSLRHSTESNNRPKELLSSIDKSKVQEQNANGQENISPGIYLRPQKSNEFAQKVDDNWDLMSLANGQNRQSTDIQNQLDLYRSLLKYQNETESQKINRNGSNLREDVLRSSKDMANNSKKKELTEEQLEKKRDKRRRKNRNRRINQDKKFENYEKGKALGRMPQLSVLKNQMSSYIQTNKEVTQMQVQLQRQLLNSVHVDQNQDEASPDYVRCQEHKDPRLQENIKQQLEYRENNDRNLVEKLDKIKLQQIEQDNLQQKQDVNDIQEQLSLRNKVDLYNSLDQKSDKKQQSESSSDSDSDLSSNDEQGDILKEDIQKQNIKSGKVEFMPVQKESQDENVNQQNLKSIQRLSSIVIANNDLPVSYSDLLKTPNYNLVYSVPEDGEEYAKIGEKFYRYEELQTGVQLPQDVDPVRREAYLNEAEFLKLFKINKQEYYKLPGWRQKLLKLEIKLF